MARIDKKYHKLLNKILDKGRWYEDPNRKGIKRLQIPHYSFEYNLKDGFPAITTKKLYWKAVVGELLWFLRGDTNIKYLVDNNINIWNKDAYNWYLKNSREDSDGHNNSLEDYIDFIKNNDKLYDENMTLNRKGDVGRIYGAQWRKFGNLRAEDNGIGNTIDQISELIQGLKEKPLSTSHIVNAWNPAELTEMALPPCHKGFQIMVYPLDKIYLKGRRGNIMEGTKYGFDLVWEQRSVDTFLGLPFNIASYALLSHIIGKLTNMIPGKIYGDLRNVHIYDNAIDSVKQQLLKDVDKYDKCELGIMEHLKFKSLDELDIWRIKDFKLLDYKSYPNIKTEMLSRDE